MIAPGAVSSERQELNALLDSNPQFVNPLLALLKTQTTKQLHAGVNSLPAGPNRRTDEGQVLQATTAATAGSIATVRGCRAVVGTITVNAQRLDTLLSEGSFDRTRVDQVACAEGLGYRLATRNENHSYVSILLAKQQNNTINDAEMNALRTYCERFVRDTNGGIDVADHQIYQDNSGWRGESDPLIGALFVRASAE